MTNSPAACVVGVTEGCIPDQYSPEGSTEGSPEVVTVIIDWDFLYTNYNQGNIVVEEHFLLFSSLLNQGNIVVVNTFCCSLLLLNQGNNVVVNTFCYSLLC